MRPRAALVTVLLLLVAASPALATAPTFNKIDITTQIAGKPGGPNSIAVCDITGDGRLDILVTNFGPGGAAPGDVVLLAGTSGTAFAAPVEVLTGTEGTRVGCADVNGDGRADLVASFGYGTDRVVVRLNTGNSAAPFGPITPFVGSSGGYATYSFSVADFNRDGLVDIAAATRLSSGNLAMLPGNPARTSDPTTLFTATRGFGDSNVMGNRMWTETGDIDGDGNPDLVVADIDSYLVDVWFGGGGNDPDVNRWFSSHVKYQVGVGTGTGAVQAGVVIGDVDGDGRQDIVSFNFDNTVTILRNKGTVDVAGHLEFEKRDRSIGPVPPTVAPTRQFGIADLDRDGRADIAVAVDTTVRVMMGNGSNTTFVDAPISTTLGGAEAAVITADLDDDGRVDLLVADSATNTLHLLYNTTSVPAQAVTTGAIVNVGQTTVTATGTIDPHDLPTRWRFEYGPTLAYGAATAPLGPERGRGGRAVQGAIGGLVPATPYHARLVGASAPAGDVAGVDIPFTTDRAHGTLSSATFAGSFSRSRFSGKITVAGSFDYATSAVIVLSRNGRVTTRLAFNAPAGAFTQVLALPTSTVPGLYAVTLEGSAGGGPIYGSQVPATLAAPREGVVDRSWMTVLRRGGPKLFATGFQTTVYSYWRFTARGARGTSYTAPCKGPRGARTTTAGSPPVSLIEFRYVNPRGFPKGRWTCTLRAGRTVVATATFRFR
jgi:hypothetical protein